MGFSSLSPNVWYNSANTNQSATLMNNDTYYYGGGILFDGNHSSVIMTHQPSMNVANLLTVITWFYVANTASNGRSLVSKTAKDGSRGYDFYNYGKNLEVVVSPMTSNNKIVVANTINANTWVMGAFTYDGVNIKGYLNGNLTNVSSGHANSATDTDQPIYIGGRYTANNSANLTSIMDGKIGIIQFYNKVLSNSEIFQSFSRYRGRFGI